MATFKVTVRDDPNLGSGPDQDASEVSLSQNYSDSGSVPPDDSALPIYVREENFGGTATTLYQACIQNDAASLRRVLERGVTREEVMELDINRRNGLMVAVARGYVDLVYGLQQCPYLDVNHQDNEGSTALMLAAQAGFTVIHNYILNYYRGVDLELRDIRGYTVLLKAVMQGNNDCVAALVMAGADINVVDMQGKNIKHWALKTGRLETLQRLRRLTMRPVAEQFCESYVVEWPDLKQQVAAAAAAKSPGQKVAHCLKSTFAFKLPMDPPDNGVIDHMVRMTTGIHSPLVATATRPLCPSSPPGIGRRRLAVPDLLWQRPPADVLESSVSHSSSSTSSTVSISSVTSTSLAAACGALASDGVRSCIPRGLTMRRNSVFPGGGGVPEIRVVESGPTPAKEKAAETQKGYLELPMWKYKEARMEKKKENEKAESEKADETKRKKAERKVKKKKKKKKKKKQD